MNWNLVCIMLITALIACAIGFYKYVYFMSVGYGFAVAAISVVSLVLFRGSLTAGTFLFGILMIAYGLRLSGFLLYREFRNRGYRNKVMKEVSGGSNELAIPIKIVLWISVSILYVLQTSPFFFRLSAGAADNGALVAACVISACGIVLETTADLQKSAQKKVVPDMVATKGLYAIVRCPNYLGEILFWTGMFVGAFGALKGIGEWIMAILGYALIFYVMVDSARRLEKKQNRNYGAKEAYWEYTDRTPILFPFVPLYHLNAKPEGGSNA